MRRVAGPTEDVAVGGEDGVYDKGVDDAGAFIRRADALGVDAAREMHGNAAPGTAEEKRRRRADRPAHWACRDERMVRHGARVAAVRHRGVGRLAHIAPFAHGAVLPADDVDACVQPHCRAREDGRRRRKALGCGGRQHQLARRDLQARARRRVDKALVQEKASVEIQAQTCVRAQKVRARRRARPRRKGARMDAHGLLHAGRLRRRALREQRPRHAREPARQHAPAPSLHAQSPRFYCIT